MNRKTVRVVVPCLDPNDVQSRAQNRLQRRVYQSTDPNFTWHLDVMIFLEVMIFPYTRIEGYSRKLLWFRSHNCGLLKD